ncbi:MAG: tetratricopeptide repeat protein [Myxococcales bacterium]
MKTAVLAALIAFPSLAAQNVSVTVRSHLDDVDLKALAEQVNDIAARTLRDNAEVSVDGEVVRVAHGLLVTLELRENGKLGATASAQGSTPEEMLDAAASAAVDLFRAWKETSALSMNPTPVPEPPAPSAALQPGVVRLDLDADLLVAFDEARSAEARGTERPEEAAAAWRVVAESIGPNPFREAAAARAKDWQSWAENKRVFEEQRSKDSARMRKVLPLAAVTDDTKVELLVRYTRAYGIDKAAVLVAFLPVSLRGPADLAIGCEAKQAASCIELARASSDPARAVDYFGRACNAGDAASCAEAGDRWLARETRDVAKAISALEAGCAGGSARACTRLARVYEEGDGTDVNPARATEMRDRACTAGDGASCRKLACDAADTRAANELWTKGCNDGDSLSCTLASVSAPRPQPAPAPVVTRAEVKSSRRPGAGTALLGVAIVAGTGAVFLALADNGDHVNHRLWGSHDLTIAARDSGSSPRRILPIALGATAAAAAVAGVALLVWQPDPGAGKVTVGVTPTGVMLSGPLP